MHFRCQGDHAGSTWLYNAFQVLLLAENRSVSFIQTVLLLDIIQNIIGNIWEAHAATYNAQQ